MLRQITERQEPVFVGPTTPLDEAILLLLEDGRAREPREIWEGTKEAAKSLSQVHARLKVMNSRGLVQRIPTPGGPLRGKGAGKYVKA
jgi:CBS domain-containing protein